MAARLCYWFRTLGLGVLGFVFCLISGWGFRLYRVEGLGGVILLRSPQSHTKA